MSALTRLALANRAVIVLATLITIGLGIFCAGALRQELIPSLTVPSASIIATYPGAGPEAVERQVTEPLESATQGVTGVTGVSSTSATNVSQLTISWDYGADRAEMESKIRTAVDSTKSTLPTGVEPQLIIGTFEDVPIIYAAVSSDLAGPQLAATLKTVALPKLKQLQGVRSADLSGEEVRQVTVTTRQADLDRLKVDPSQLQQLLLMYTAPIPAGAVTEAGKDDNVQVGKTLSTVEDIKNIQLQGSDGPVTLSSVADVVDEPVTTTTISRVNGKPALALSVTKNADANTVTVAKEVNDALADLSTEIGSNTKFTTIFDQAPFIEQSIHDLTVEGGLGLVMAVLVILIFLWSVRPTIITAISIPLSLLITFIALYLTDYTLNLITLSALTVAVGRVVDDSIVVIENIERHLHSGDPFSAATIVKAVKEVAGAVTASTITTVAVFAPISLVSGQAGELFRPFGITVTVALLASLFVALTIVPVLASWFMRPSRRPPSQRRLARQEAAAAKLNAAEDARHDRELARAQAKQAKREAKQAAFLDKNNADEPTREMLLAELRAKHPLPIRDRSHEQHESAQTRLQRGYLPVLRAALRHPVITLVLAAVLFVSTMGLAALLKTDFIGDAGQTTLTISQEMPSGTTLQATDAATKKVEGVLAADDAVETYSSTIGGTGDAFTGTQGGANRASISITLKADQKATDLAGRLRTKFAAMSDIGDVEVITNDGGTGSQAIEIELQGSDEKALTTAGGQVEKMLTGLDGMSQVTSDLAEQQTVLQVNVNEPVAAGFGMSQATIGAAAIEALKGQNIGTMTVGDVDRDIILRSRKQLTSRAELENLQLPVTQQQTADAQQAAADRLTEQSNDEADKALADQRQALRESEDKLRDSRAQLQSQLATLTAQLQALQSAPLPPPSPAPTTTDPLAERATQIAQLQEGISQLRSQLQALTEQQTQLDDQRESLAEQQVKTEDARQQSEDAKNAKGTPKLLKEVASVQAIGAPASITRTDGSRQVTVSGVPGGGNLTAATAAVQKGLDGLELPAGVTASIGGVSQEQSEAFTQLFLAMAIAIAIVYMVMVTTFRSLLQPLILLISIPFAATGAIGLLLITNTALGLPAMIGLLMLIGIVVTNAIVLIDLVNTYRARGASIDDAVIHGARLRLRPIIMTALATIMALFPMSLGLTGGGVFISKPLAIVVIGGLISSTLLTLVLVPVLYHLLETGRERLSGWRRRRRGAEDGPDQVSTAVQQADSTEDLDGLDDLLDGRDGRPGPQPG